LTGFSRPPMRPPRRRTPASPASTRSFRSASTPACSPPRTSARSPSANGEWASGR
jgi:hypothetical protein